MDLVAITVLGIRISGTFVLGTVLVVAVFGLVVWYALTHQKRS